jgi:hypothetical protein
MKNPLVERVEKEFGRLGFHGAELIRESYLAESFGNAEAVYKIGDLYIYFICDRGNDMVDWISDKLSSKKDTYNFDDISILMGWESLEEMVKKYKYTNVDYSKLPPGPVFSLSDELQLVKEHYDELQRMFSPSELEDTLKQLKETCRKRCRALFDWEPKL